MQAYRRITCTALQEKALLRTGVHVHVSLGLTSCITADVCSPDSPKSSVIQGWRCSLGLGRPDVIRPSPSPCLLCPSPKFPRFKFTISDHGKGGERQQEAFAVQNESLGCQKVLRLRNVSKSSLDRSESESNSSRTNFLAPYIDASPFSTRRLPLSPRENLSPSTTPTTKCKAPAPPAPLLQAPSSRSLRSCSSRASCSRAAL